jgi:fucose 4-O-acetylase-like acetyltransferase
MIVKKAIDYNLISKYRTELMGIAMLDVLILHFLSWSKLSSPQWLVLLLDNFGRLIFTEGFLFLSGFGLYYSFSKNASLSQFYHKRLNRLLIPYILISLPFFLREYCLGEFGVDILLLKLSTLYFWLYGNDGMWYISLSVLLYAILPILYRGCRRWVGVILLILLCVLGLVFLYKYANDYYMMTQLGITKIPFFIAGIYAGAQSKQCKHFNLLWVGVLVVLLLLLYKVEFEQVLIVRESVRRLLGLLLCCLILSMVGKYRFVMMPLKKLGEYSLEIYIMHMCFRGLFSDYISDIWLASLLPIIASVLLCKPAHYLCTKVTSLPSVHKADN